MASSAADDTYCNENICSIEDFMSEKSCPLPAVVRVTPSDYEVPDSGEEIPTKIEFLLSKLEKIKFVRVKVLPFDREDQVKGTEFASRRSELVGRGVLSTGRISRQCEMYTPTRCPKVIYHHKGDDLPRYIKFNTDSPSCNASGKLNKGQMVVSGSVLILSKLSTFKDSAFRFLTCSIGNKNFLFREDQEVKLEAINDGQLHNFSELSCLRVLPLFIQLDYVSPMEIVCDDDDAAESLLTVLSGPLEVTLFVKSTMLLAWTSNGENKPCTKVLLLRKSARDRNVVMHANFTDEEAKDYIEQHFRDFNKTEWLRKSMYALHADKTNTERFIWLKRPLPRDACDSHVTTNIPNGPIQNPKPVASVKPRVATKQGGVAAKQDNCFLVSPGTSIIPEYPEESTQGTRNRGNDYLNSVPEMENESGQQIMVITDTNLTAPKAHDGPERQTSSSSKTNAFDSSTKTTLMHSLNAIGQSHETKTPIPSTHLTTTNNKNQDADRLLKNAPQSPLKPCSPSVSLTTTESNTATNAGDAVITSVVQPLTSSTNKLTHKGNDAYVNVGDNDSSSKLHLTTCTSQQSINNSHELSPTSFSKSAQCTQNETVTCDIVDRTDDPPHIPPKPHTSFPNTASNNIIDTTAIAVNKDNASNRKLAPKPSAKPNRVKNNDSPASGIYLQESGGINCVTPSLTMSPLIFLNASLADTSRRSPLTPQRYPDTTDETRVLYPEKQQRSEKPVLTANTKSQSESAVYLNMGSPQTLLSLKTPPIKVKPKLLPKPRNDGYEEMIKHGNETFVLNMESGPKNKLYVQPKPIARDDDENPVPNVNVRNNTSSNTNVSAPPIRPNLDNSELEHLDDNDYYEEIKDPLNTLSDNEVNQEDTSEFAKGVDVTNVMRTGQTKEHFYDYSVLDVHECFKMCFPENIEISNLTLEYRLDGEFFRDDGLESFCDAAKVGGLQKKEANENNKRRLAT